LHGRSMSAAFRNIYAADAPGFEPRRITPYREDDGQELTQLSFSGDGTTIVYVRGGDHGSNRQAEAPAESRRGAGSTEDSDLVDPPSLVVRRHSSVMATVRS